MCVRAKSLRCAEGKRESMKPVIGIIAACTREVHPAYTTGHDYVRAVERAGGLALLLPATPDAVSAGMAQWLALCGGFVLPGGGDVAPTYYGQSPVPQLTSTDRLRDNVELTLCRAAAQHKKPLLGICRGAQVLNVAFGGDLFQDVPDPQHHMATKETGDAIHTVRAQHDLMREFYGEEFPVNSAHHQAADKLGAGLIPLCVSDDGINEGFIHENGKVIGVQFHPEAVLTEYGHELLENFNKICEEWWCSHEKSKRA